jgi:hypothetical protein
VAGEDSEVVNRGFKLSSPTTLLRRGWSRRSLDPGDVITGITEVDQADRSFRVHPRPGIVTPRCDTETGAMRTAFVSALLLLPFVAAPALSDPGRDESGHSSRDHSERHREAEERAREWRKREEEQIREAHKRALEWEREHGHYHEGYPIVAPHVTVPYATVPAYPPEGITITRDGINVWFTLHHGDAR